MSKQHKLVSGIGRQVPLQIKKLGFFVVWLVVFVFSIITILLGEEEDYTKANKNYVFSAFKIQSNTYKNSNRLLSQ